MNKGIATDFSAICVECHLAFINGHFRNLFEAAPSAFWIYWFGQTSFQVGLFSFLTDVLLFCRDNYACLKYVNN